MAAPNERTGLLKAASPMESVARDKATAGEHKDHHLEVEPRVLQAAAELVEALESTSKNYKLQESGAALLAAQIRSNLRLVDQCVSNLLIFRTSHLRSPRLIILAYILILPLFERPLWCFFDSHCGKDVNVPDSGMPRLPWAGSVVRLSPLSPVLLMSTRLLISLFSSFAPASWHSASFRTDGRSSLDRPGELLNSSSFPLVSSTCC